MGKNHLILGCRVMRAEVVLKDLGVAENILYTFKD
jgi:hypothetical protein